MASLNVDFAAALSLPLVIASLGYLLALRTFRKLPITLPLLSFHALAYPIMLVLSLAAVLLEFSSSTAPLYNDGFMFLLTGFAAAGTIIAWSATTIAWVVQRHRPLSARSGRLLSAVACLPYVLVALILVFYQE